MCPHLETVVEMHHKCFITTFSMTEKCSTITVLSHPYRSNPHGIFRGRQCVWKYKRRLPLVRSHVVAVYFRKWKSWECLFCYVCCFDQLSCISSIFVDDAKVGIHFLRAIWLDRKIWVLHCRAFSIRQQQCIIQLFLSFVWFIRKVCIVQGNFSATALCGPPMPIGLLIIINENIILFYVITL